MVGPWMILRLLFAWATLCSPSESLPTTHVADSLKNYQTNISPEEGPKMCPINVVSLSGLPDKSVTYLEKYDCVSQNSMAAREVVQPLVAGGVAEVSSGPVHQSALVPPKSRFRAKRTRQRRNHMGSTCEAERMACMADDGSKVTAFTMIQPLLSPFCVPLTGLLPPHSLVPCVPLKGTSGCAIVLKCAEQCDPENAQCRETCKNCKPIPGNGAGLCQPYSKQIYDAFFSCVESNAKSAIAQGALAKYHLTCPMPGFPDVLSYKAPAPVTTSETREEFLPSSFEASQRDHCDDLTDVRSDCCLDLPWYASVVQKAMMQSISCPCVSCSRVNIAYSKEKAEMIAIIRATDKVLAVCRNARICVGGLKDLHRYTFFDTRPGFGPCIRWAGGGRSDCSLQVYTKIKRIQWGWRVIVRATFGEEQWAFPVNNIQYINRDFTMTANGEPGAQPLVDIDLRRSTAANLAKEAFGAPQHVLVLTRPYDQELTYDITCPEVAEGYPLEAAPPSLPPYVTRKTHGKGPTVDSAIDPPDLRTKTPFEVPNTWPQPSQVLEDALHALDEVSYNSITRSFSPTGSAAEDVAAEKAVNSASIVPKYNDTISALTDVVTATQQMSRSVDQLATGIGSLTSRLN